MVSKKLILLTVAIGGLAYWLSSRLQTGSCSSFQTMQKFEPQKVCHQNNAVISADGLTVILSSDQYMGKWYEIVKYPMIWELGLKCVTATYSLNKDGTVGVHNQGIVK